MYRTSLTRSRYLILLALLLHSFTKTVIHHSLIQLYVSVQFLLALIMWNGYVQPDTKLICPIGVIVVLSDFGQVHVTLSRKWHTVAQELDNFCFEEGIISNHNTLVGLFMFSRAVKSVVMVCITHS